MSNPGGTVYGWILAKHKKGNCRAKNNFNKRVPTYFGRALMLCKKWKSTLTYPEYEIVIFGAHQEVCSFIEK
jgi:hypothetical protein